MDFKDCGTKRNDECNDTNDFDPESCCDNYSEAESDAKADGDLKFDWD